MATKTAQLEHILMKSGLSEKEAKVYFAALSLGPTTILELARKSELKRTTMYDVVDRLMKKGLMSEMYVGLKKRFVAETPRALDALLTKQQETFHKHLPELMNMYSFPSAEQSVKVYEGIEGLKNSLNSMLDGLQPGDTYYVIANIENILELVGDFFYTFAKKRATYNITLQTMLQDGPLTRDYVAWAKNTREEIKILKPESPFMANIVVTPYRVVMPHIKPFTGAIAIENQQAVATHQQLFRMLWENHADTT